MDLNNMNKKSKVKNSYKVDNKYFIQRIDESAPNHSFKREEVWPQNTRPNSSKFTQRFVIPNSGLLGKMYLYHEMTGFTAFSTSDKANLFGMHIFERAHIMHKGKILETLTPEILVSRKNSTQDSHLEDLIAQASDGTTVSATQFKGYTPLLFDLTSNLNTLLDAQFIDGDLELVIEYAKISDITDDAGVNNVSHTVKLLCDFLVISDYEKFARVNYSKKKIYNYTNVYEEARSSVSAGVNTFNLKCRENVKEMIVKVENDSTNLKNGRTFTDFKLIIDGMEKMHVPTRIDLYLLNKSYQGFVSERVPNLASNTFWKIDFTIPSLKNADMGSLNFGGSKDIKLSLNSSGAGTLKVDYVYYTNFELTPSGKLKKTLTNEVESMDMIC